MARKSTIDFAQKTLTPEEFAAWQAMPVKLSKSQLKAGERPPLGVVTTVTGHTQQEARVHAKAVKDAKKASEWITRFDRPEGLGAYTHIMRGPNDPERLSRKERQEKFPDSSSRWKAALKVTPENIKAWREKILEVLADCTPRTFNCICLQASGHEYTADTAFDMAPDKALWGLMSEGLLQCTTVAPIHFLINEAERERLEDVAEAERQERLRSERDDEDFEDEDDASDEES